MSEVVAVVPNLMDRSRLTAPPGMNLRFSTPAALRDAASDIGDVDLIVVDLTVPDALALIAAVGDGPRVIGFGPHVDDELLAAARAAGWADVLPRSRFFARWPNL